MKGLLRETRSQHGREHATVAVMLEWGIRPPLGGNAAPGGFLIYSRATTEQVTLAAEEALRRLQSGQEGLAVSVHCGTNLLVAAGIGALVSSVISGRSPTPQRRMTSLMAGIAAALLLRRRAGAFVQRHVTTLPDSRGVGVRSVRGFQIYGMTVHWVSTGRVAA